MDRRQQMRSASFDCRSAATAIEQAICGDDELAALDLQMGQALQRVTRLATDKQSLLESQRRWIVQRSRMCTTPSGILHSCLSNLTKQRISELANWTAQASLSTPPGTKAEFLADATAPSKARPNADVVINNTQSQSSQSRTQSTASGQGQTSTSGRDPDLWTPVVVFAVVLALIGFGIAIRRQRAREEEERRAQQEALAAQRTESLIARYGHEAAERILAHVIWQGMTSDQLMESRGAPADIDSEVIRSKTKETWKYHPNGRNRYLLRVYLQNGTVYGWKE